MPDEERYVPLSERLNQDVWHDNFVPKYSALASAQPSRLVLIGVWMIFGPMALSALVVGLSSVRDSTDVPMTVISSVTPLLAFGLAAAILITQTRRYLYADRDSESDSDE